MVYMTSDLKLHYQFLICVMCIPVFVLQADTEWNFYSSAEECFLAQHQQGFNNFNGEFNYLFAMKLLILKDLPYFFKNQWR